MTRSEVFCMAVWNAREGRKPEYKDYEKRIEVWKRSCLDWQQMIIDHEQQFTK